MKFLAFLYFAFIHQVFHARRRVRSGDRSVQFCRPPRPIPRSFKYSATCRLKYVMPRYSVSTSIIVFCAVKDACMTLMFYVRFKPSWIPNVRSSVIFENGTYVRMTFLLGIASGIRPCNTDIKSPYAMYFWKQEKDWYLWQRSAFIRQPVHCYGAGVSKLFYISFWRSRARELKYLDSIHLRT
jgi:hypothetical protein